MKNWTVADNHLAYCDDYGVLHHPSASEIMNCMQGEGIPPVACSEGELSFSRLCASIECSFVFESDRKYIAFRVFAVRSGKTVPVDFLNGKTVDHVIISGRWMYLGDGSRLLNEMLEKVSVRDDGKTDFDSYLTLSRELRSCEIIEFSDFITPEDILNLSQEKPQVPDNLNAALFPYQKEGFEWMVRTLSVAHGFLLGDEMGLGKTLQIITLLLYHERKADIHALIVAPVSLLVNWAREISRFAPSLTFRIHSGGMRTGLYSDLFDVNVIITSYGTAVKDLSMLKMSEWDFLILDEGQNIRNPNSERAVQIKKIPRKNSIVMSGTPFENHLTDIWSIYDFVHPGLLGELSAFKDLYHDNVYNAERIEPIITPFMIRRRVSDVRKDLPEKIIDNQELMMTDYESGLYEKIRGTEHDKKDTLGILTKLRLLCTHPFLVDDSLPKEAPEEYSAKYSRFIEIVEEIIANDEKLIVFTTYRKMNELIVNDLRRRFGIYTDFIDGSTSDRQQKVDDFSSQEGSAVLVVNPKAGGAGLNITSATHVVHYNLEWNPALESQASARAYRTGQTRNVIIHRLFYSGTVEEYINDLMERKKEIGEAAVIGSNGFDDLNIDLIQALRKTPKGGMNT